MGRTVLVDLGLSFEILRLSLGIFVDFEVGYRVGVSWSVLGGEVGKKVGTGQCKLKIEKYTIVLTSWSSR